MIKNCYVYFITEVYTNRLKGKPAVKIGLAVNVERRVKELQTGNARQLEAVLAIGPMSEKTAATLERHLHRRFKRLRLKGEWFEPDVVRRLQNLTNLSYDGDIEIFESEFMSDGRYLKKKTKKIEAKQNLDRQLIADQQRYI